MLKDTSFATCHIQLNGITKPASQAFSWGFDGDCSQHFKALDSTFAHRNLWKNAYHTGHAAIPNELSVNLVPRSFTLKNWIEQASPAPSKAPSNEQGKNHENKVGSGFLRAQGIQEKSWGSMYSQSPMALFHSARIDSFFRSPGSMAKMLRLQESKDLPLPNHCLSPVWNPDRTRVIKIIFLLTINFKFSFKRRPQKITN